MPPLNVAEYEQAARELLSPMIADFVAGGSGEQATLHGNRAAFDRWRLLPRVLTGTPGSTLETTVLGQPVSLPVLLAPVGMQRLSHDEGELASARASRVAGTIFTLSTTATYSIEEVSQVAGTWWFQLYIYRDRDVTRDLVARAEAAGAAALVVTVDTPVIGRREADERNNFALPDGITFANFVTTAHHRMPSVSGSGIAAYTTASFDPAVGWADIDWLASISRLPIVVKGLLSPDDARLAAEHGARGVVVSNHGGRQLDNAVATLDALPAVVEAVDGRLEVLLDGGIRRGTDVLKALALGARAVFIGRGYVWPLAVGGEAGVVHALNLLRDELSISMTLCGCARVEDASRALVVPVGPLVTG